jgi:prolipoprotein diacylglyceryl transferase
MNLYIIWDVRPQIIPEFDYLRWYGISWVLGIILGLYIMRKIYRTEGNSVDQLDTLATYIIVGTILGARLGHIIFYDPHYYWQNPIEILPFRFNPEFEFTGLAGLASHGGIFGALLALYVYHRKYACNYLRLLDRLTIAAAATGGVVRLGNLMNSEIIGIPTNVPWAFIFTNVDQVPRHPAQLYEALFYFTLSTLLFFVWKSGRYSGNRGFIFGLGVSLIFIQRFLIEFLKENQVSFEEGLLINMGQILSIPLAITGIIIMLYSLNKPTKGCETKLNEYLPQL